MSVSGAPHPAEVPVRPAATLMLVRDCPDLHVLLAGFENGELLMLPPTLGMLRALARFAGSAEAVAAAARHEDGPDVEAKLAGRGRAWRVLLPGDPDYRDAATLQPMRAWVRLWSVDEGSA